MGLNYAFIDYKSKNGSTTIYLEQSHAFSIDKKAIRDRSEKIELDQTKASISQFRDSTMESLELRGYNFDWLEGKKYVSIQTMEEFNTIFLPDFVNHLSLAVARGEKLLATMDFESTGLNAYDEKCPNRDTATFLGISFTDDEAYGLFLDMEHFDNLPVKEVAEVLTCIFKRDLTADRDIEILGKLFKRSDIVSSGHNIMIDIRFGLTVDMDIWFNVCSMQLGFNLDPFLTRGNNGAKDRVKQFFDIDYPELGETAGKEFYGYFNRFSDKRVIMMYGCADVDLVRMFTKKMLEQIPLLEPYLGVNQVTQFHRLDEIYLNMKARFDYVGVRVNMELAKQRAHVVTSKIKTIHTFLSAYVPRATLAVTYLTRLRHEEEAGRDITKIAPPNLDDVAPIQVDKWSGDFLISVLFKMLEYPILFFTNSDDPKRRKPRLDKDAVQDYLQHTVDVTYPVKVTSLPTTVFVKGITSVKRKSGCFVLGRVSRLDLAIFATR